MRPGPDVIKLFSCSTAEHEIYLANKLGDNCIQIFHLGRYIVGYTVGKFVFRATRQRSRKT